MKIGKYKRSFTVEPVESPVPRKDTKPSEPLPPPGRVRVKTPGRVRVKTHV